MKTIKIIDLLNKIANGEEVPKKVQINGGIHGIDVWKYDEICRDYISSSNILLLYSGMTTNHLTDEVEIIEDRCKCIDEEVEKLFKEEKEIEKCDVLEHCVDFSKNENILLDNQLRLQNKINELIDAVNEKRRGN